VAYFNYRTRSGDMLDVLCTRIYRRDGMIPMVLESNPDLTAHDVKLPAGVIIAFPKLDTDTSKEKTQVIRLWG
jgi:phage tail protein X